MKMRFPSWTLFLLMVLAGRPLCADGPPLMAPDGQHWVVEESVPPVSGSDDLLPTQRLRLEDRTDPKGLVLLDGVRDMCATDVRWTDGGVLDMRVPEGALSGLHVYDGEVWDSVLIRVRVHDDLVLKRAASPDGSLDLLEIESCESGDWNLYLRHAGDADYNPAMKLGWGDPSLFGGYMGALPLLDLEWTGPHSACAEVAYGSYGTKVRHEVQGVKMEWVYNRHYHRPPVTMISVAPARLTLWNRLVYKLKNGFNE